VNWLFLSLVVRLKIVMDEKQKLRIRKGNRPLNPKSKRMRRMLSLAFKKIEGFTGLRLCLSVHQILTVNRLFLSLVVRLKIVTDEKHFTCRFFEDYNGENWIRCMKCLWMKACAR
jgi:hypothetical protein